jgi:threonine dehydratase
MTDATIIAPAPNKIHAAASLLAPHIIRTPLLRLNTPDSTREIYLKLENLQPIGAYKVRSIGNVMLSARANALRKGVYTASSGNAGLGLAWMAQKLGIQATVYAPESSPAAKLDAIRQFGAQVHLMGADQWWQVIQNRGHATDPGMYVDAVRDAAALAGNGTIGLEIAEQLPDVANIIVPFGGGGVACGISAAIRAVKPGTRIIVAESDAATPATAAFKVGRPVTVNMKPSFISGAGAPSVLEEMWPLVRELIDDTRVVPVAEVAAAIRYVCKYNHVIAEGAGAIPVAAALADRTLSGKIVCVVTGGNIDTEIIAKILLQQL